MNPDYFHYVLTAVFALGGAMSLLAAIFDWKWFFETSSARMATGRSHTSARVFYGIAGVALLVASFFCIIFAVEI